MTNPAEQFLPARRRLLATLSIGCMPMLLGGCAQPALPQAAPAPPPAPPRDWFVFLERGPTPRPADDAVLQAMQRGHIANFERLAAQGRLSAAGPLKDPSGHKRGIVVVRASSLDELRGYFDADDYVRLGHMSLNAVPATAGPALVLDGVDRSTMEEGRILLLGRRAGSVADPSAESAGSLRLAALLAQGRLSARYVLDSGPLAEVLFARGNDDEALRQLLSSHPGVASGDQSLAIWPQWFAKGVLR